MPNFETRIAPVTRPVIVAALIAAIGLTPRCPVQATSVNLEKGSVELSPAPIELGQEVPPNVVVTFDDSGSMVWTYMGDKPPFSETTWNGPWACAATIDADPGNASDAAFRQTTMNGVYYNPNVKYAPPVRADGSSFPDADATLAAVWVDGIAINRGYQPVAPGGVGYHHNPFSDAAPPGARTNIATTVTTNLWKCGFSVQSPTTGVVAPFLVASPMDGQVHALSDGTQVMYPLGGPYYYRLKKNISIPLDNAGKPTSTSQLYSSNSWEAIPVPSTQYQNFANWYAYYRHRHQVARTAASRVFGDLGVAREDGGFGASIRIAWQHLNATQFLLPAQSIISELVDAKGCTNGSNANPGTVQQAGGTTPPACYRSAFFNWLFTAPAGGGTPIRTATLRAGEFFRRSGDGLKNPYWVKNAEDAGVELYCRRNYHMLITDGLWNVDAPSRGSLRLPSSGLTLPDDVVFPNPDTPGVTALYAPIAAVGGQASLSDIAFHYWASNLRPELYRPERGEIVPPHLPDRTQGITPSTLLSGSRVTEANVNQEIYFNPANDPATWPHMSEYLVGMGVGGTLEVSTDTHCDNPASDACKLRKRLITWPIPNGAQNGILQNVDDTWHAALAGRGQYFSASDPQTLINQLSDILVRIAQRDVPAALGQTSSPLLIPGTLGFQTLYSSGEWNGSLQAVEIDGQGNVGSVVWDAAALLTDATVSPPDKRQILTASYLPDGGFARGIPFRHFADLDQDGRTWLDNTPLPKNASDTGQLRMNWVRGDRTSENAGILRNRSQLFGAVVNSQALYLAYPVSGYLDKWPDQSPEALAASAGRGYEPFVADHLGRRPIVYVAANDGMLHAIDASQEKSATDPTQIVPGPSAGQELFAYVPRMIYPRLGGLSSRSDFSFMPNVNDTPVTRDVFFSQGTQRGWRSLLVGGLRLGGRGIYALDVSDPDSVTESNADQTVLWEFQAGSPGTARFGSGDASHLGYTYGQPNIGRLAHGRWVVLLPSGYFPDCSQPAKPEPCNSTPESAAPFSSLFVLDAQTGALVREIRTPSAGNVVSHGLSSVVLGDYNNDQIDDVAFAGDLVGNLWRFDLTNSDPAQWSATLAFEPDVPGVQPITVMPRLFPDPVTRRFIIVFGTGQLLASSDNTSLIPTQSIYGIRDNLSPARRTALQPQTMVEQAGAGNSPVRGVTNHPVAADKQGWYLDLDLANARGERVLATPVALFDSNRIVLATWIPGSNNPCATTNEGAAIALDAATGGSGSGNSNAGVPEWEDPSSPYRAVGGRISNPPTSGNLPIGLPIGGGSFYIPGKNALDGSATQFDDAIWRRRSWRRLQ